jgi:hypothetical protein
MAHYLVTARPDPERLPTLLERLCADAFSGLRPFGRALTYSLRHARIAGDGHAVWEEEDYCSPPLAEERAAVLDKFFSDLAVERVERGAGWERIRSLPPLFPVLKDDDPRPSGV